MTGGRKMSGLFLNPKRKNVAIVLAAGQGSRMNSDVAKQYIELKGKPVLYYSLKRFEESFINEIILVVPENDIDYVKENIVEKYSIKKVSRIIAGGKERYHSVYEGLKAIDCADFVFIHDGARPLIKTKTIETAYAVAISNKSAVVAVPVKDTVKKVNFTGIISETLEREKLWAMQTPQVFEFTSIKNAYEKAISEESGFKERKIKLTDDAMVMEQFGGMGVHISQGDYTNIKITTQEDLLLAEFYMNNGSNES